MRAGETPGPRTPEEVAAARDKEDAKRMAARAMDIRFEPLVAPPRQLRKLFSGESLGDTPGRMATRLKFGLTDALERE